MKSKVLLQLKTVIATIFIVFSGIVCKDKPEKNSSSNESATVELALVKSSKTKFEMIWIEGGAFQMDAQSKGYYVREYPAHQVEVDGFWMDKHEVTNTQYGAFLEAAYYITVAKSVIDLEDLKKELLSNTSKQLDRILQLESLVFKAPERPTGLNDIANWWYWTIGANWKYPQALNSTITDKINHPVVHMAYEDAFT